jgi:murein DD-endopeptidase MepM/ murein hydrolase activator NlpD
MAAKRYKFNPQTLTYEVITLPFQVRFYRMLRHVLIAFLFASLMTLLFSYFFYTPKMYRISAKRDQLLIQYRLLGERIEASEAQLADIRQRDNSVYRALFAVDTLNLTGIYTPYPDSKYASFADDRYAPLIGQTWHSLDALGRRLYVESKSFDELAPMALDKEKMAESIPAIWPVDRKQIRSIGSYGRRIDPVYRTPAFHHGMDFSGPTGTPIYATGNGRVIIPVGTSGYGRQVMVDHGFGYRTRYGHLFRLLVEPGQEVKRGEQIGEMGSTGKSTGSHLHYEVIYRGVDVNPIGYLGRDMTEEDYRQIIELANRPDTPWYD